MKVIVRTCVSQPCLVSKHVQNLEFTRLSGDACSLNITTDIFEKTLIQPNLDGTAFAKSINRPQLSNTEKSLKKATLIKGCWAR